MEALNKPRLLVVGGTGFIGHHLLAATKNDWQVTSISINPPSAHRLIKDVRYIQLDMTDFNAVKASVSEEYDYVVNLSGYIDHRSYKDGGLDVIDGHFKALQNLIAVLSRRSLKRFVQIGSSDEYGDLPAPQVEIQRERPISSYALGKVACTHLIQMLCKTEGFPGVVLRLFLTYGPHQSQARFLPQVIDCCLADKEFPVTEGNQIRDFCHVDDVVDSILLVLRSNDADGHIFNIASGNPVSIREVIENVQRITGGGRPQYGVIPHRVGESMMLYADIDKANCNLGWRPTVDLETGLLRTIQAFHAPNT